jgi:sugar phosphate isomerase/epimerase
MLSIDNLSVQLYTVREAAADDLDAVLERLAQIGFRRVEPYGLLDFAAQLATSLPRHGLTAPTTHASIIGQDQDVVFGTAADLGIQIVIEPAVRDDRWTDEDAVKRIADDLNAASETAARHGLRVGYHNHWWEVVEIGDALGLEVLARNLSPEVVLEVDTYWAYAGGADVPALLQRLGDRVVALHIKDGDGSLDTKKQVPVGSGSLPVQDFLAAAPDALVVVELDDSEGDLVEAVGASRTFLIGGAA